MQIRQLQQFLALADARYFNVAAERVGLTQSALTQAIAKLEKDLGVKLFVRSKNGSILTEDGEALREHAKVILAQVNAAETELKVRSQYLRKEVRFGVIKSMHDDLVVRIFGAFTDRYSKYNVRLFKEWSSTLLELLAEGEIDFAFVSDHFMYADSHQIVSTPVFTDRVQVVVGAGHPLAQADQVDIHQLSEFRWVAVTITPGQRAALARSFSSADASPPAEIFETNAASLARHLIESGDYVGLASPKSVLWGGELGEGLRFFDVPELQMERCFSLCRRARMVLRPAHEHLLTSFTRVVRDCVGETEPLEVSAARDVGTHRPITP